MERLLGPSEIIRTGDIWRCRCSPNDHVIMGLIVNNAVGPVTFNHLIFYKNCNVEIFRKIQDKDINKQ